MREAIDDAARAPASDANATDDARLRPRRDLRPAPRAVGASRSGRRASRPSATRCSPRTSRARHARSRSAPATDEELARVHAARYLDELERESCRARPAGSIPTPTSRRAPGTRRARRPARRASSRCACWRASCAQGIAVVRPPGHHATRDRAMGFCLLNNVAVGGGGGARGRCGARRDRRLGRPPRQRHAGHLLGRSERPVHVGAPVSRTTRAPARRRRSAARTRAARRSTSACRAAPRDADYAAVFDHVFVPALARVQAGSDPDLAPASTRSSTIRSPACASRTPGFARDGARLRARRRAARRGGRIVAVLEGGYDLDGLAGGMTAALERAGRGDARRDRRSRALPADDTLARAAIDGTLAAHAAAGVPIPARSRREAPRPPISSRPRSAGATRCSAGSRSAAWPRSISRARPRWPASRRKS